MGRRRDGLVLVALVLLAAIVGPRVVPRTVPGRGEMAPVPGPPSAGDCVLQPVEQSIRIIHTGSRRPTYLPAAVGRCGRSRYGEVASVMTAGETPPAPDVSGPDQPNPVEDRCSTDASRYAGLPADRQEALLTYWQPAATLGTAVTGPSALQVAMGQHWLACITFIAGIDGHALEYDHTVRNGYSTGHLPRAASQCLSTADPESERVECTAPHQAELFGSAVTEVPAADLQPSCAALVTRLTGIPEPTHGEGLRGGQLTVETVQQKLAIITFDTSGKQVSTGPTGFTTTPVCLVVVAGHHALAGPLTDLGTRPVPWA